VGLSTIEPSSQISIIYAAHERERERERDFSTSICWHSKHCVSSDHTFYFDSYSSLHLHILI
jgi:hypothetical protein